MAWRVRRECRRQIAVWQAVRLGLRLGMAFSLCVIGKGAGVPTLNEMSSDIETASESILSVGTEGFPSVSDPAVQPGHQAVPSAQLQLLWSDEFDASALHNNNWSYETGTGCNGWGNNQVVWFTAGDNLGFSNGNAVFTAKYNAAGGSRTYTSSQIISRWKQSFGSSSGSGGGIRFETRVQLPAGGSGIWPMIYLASPDEFYGSWPQSGYIIPMEARNNMGSILGSVFWGNPSTFDQKTASVGDGGFHTYTVDWTPGSMAFYVDGVNYMTSSGSRWSTSDSTNQPKGQFAPFDRTFYVGITLGIGGGIVGSVDNAIFPQTMLVDYVRVYQLSSPAPSPSPPPPPPTRKPPPPSLPKSPPPLPKSPPPLPKSPPPLAKSPPPLPKSPPPPPPSTGLQLLWSDEFSGTSLNTGIWNFDVGGGGWGNNELEYYTPGNNVAVSNGNAVITIRYNANGGNQKYTSTRMKTQNTRFWSPANGVNGRGIRVEARIKLPTGGPGMWPAFWMMPQDSVYGGWPASGEIDIMEAINTLDTCYGTAHWGSPHTFKGGNVPMTNFGVAQQDYHIFAIDWSSSGITWRLDNQPYYSLPCSTFWTSNPTGYPTGPCAPFDRAFYVIFNVAVGGNWPGSNIDNSLFPQTMLIDYVRVYSL
eukprot:jgi/Botrbrau1/22300/Bobra.0138s0052.2